MVANVRISADEFFAQPETNQHIQLVDGEIIVTTPTDLHQEILGSIYFVLRSTFPSGAYRLSPTGIRMDDHNVLVPDLFWVSPENTRCHVVDGRYWHGAPDLVIEILSPSTSRYDRDVKFRQYARHGVREYWIVEPEAAYIEVYRLKDGDFERAGTFGKGETLVTPTLNGAAISMDAIFA